MRKVAKSLNRKLGSDVSQAFQLLHSGKPYLCFNSDFQISDCNDLFIRTFKIDKNKLLSIDLTLQPQNNIFIEAIRKAWTEVISTYHGNVLLDAGLTEMYIEAVLINSECWSSGEEGISCYILEHEIQSIDNKSQTGSQRFDPELPGCRSASVSVHTIDGSAIYISPSTEAMLGYSCAEIKEIGSLNLVYAADLPKVKNAIEKLNSGLNFLDTKYRMVRKDGSVVFVESTSYMLGDASGNTKHIVNISWDMNSPHGIERALQISEQKYYRLVMNLPLGVSLINANGKLIEANDAMKKIMRLPENFLIPEIDFLNIEGMNRSGISAQFRKCVETKEDVNGEIQLNLSNKSIKTFLSYSFVPILDHTGNVESVIGYVNDLTKQKKAESDNHKRSDFLNLVINSIKTPFFVKDEDHRWVMLNDAAVEMMGYPREALIGKSDFDLFPKEQADVFWKYDELVFKSGSNSNEEQITWSDGTVRTIVTHKQLYVEKFSDRKFIVGTIHDITSYKKIEEKLRASNIKYRELFDNANDFIITTNLDGQITNANRTLLRYLQTDLESLKQHNVFEFIEEEHIGFAREIQAKMVGGESDQSFEIKAYGVSREPVIYEVKASLIRRNNIPYGVQCVFSDVTLRKEASLRLEKYNASLLELNETKDKFFSIIAHDLRNPYSSIIGFTEMLLEDLDSIPKEEVRDTLKIIYSAAKNSFNLLDNLLAWSRLETGHISFTPVMIELVEAVEEVVNVLFSTAYRKKIDISNLVKPEVILLADKNMLNIILNNLIMNAIKFTDIGGEIKIYSEALASEPGLKTNFVKISVSDTGVGIDAKTTENLFSANRMLSTPGTEREQGTGLGLLLTREMVEKHGGKISVESSPGKGSVFSFLMPVFKPET